MMVEITSQSRDAEKGVKRDVTLSILVVWFGVDISTRGLRRRRDKQLDCRRLRLVSAAAYQDDHWSV